METSRNTLYIAPGYNSCNVYWMPYPMRPGQSPSDLNQKFKDKWICIGQLNHELKLRFLDPAFKQYADDITGQMGGTYFEIPETFPEKYIRELHAV